MNKTHKKSLELLNKFLEETPAKELQDTKLKFEGLNIEGPTFNEYLEFIEKTGHS